ncbi:hypothetical protein A6R68_13264 [Neotoma lepida]|uniref:Uncharacterized protein n=1 Tax=Neotoma lepida TaxID=56216 RepID=A0A1A6H3I6_NEOLE|nr:hypothetical protein A6R68_13264 [Neotoma lepida]
MDQEENIGTSQIFPVMSCSCWSTDILSTVGYDSIIQHLNNGRKNCKEFEEFLKESSVTDLLLNGDAVSFRVPYVQYPEEPHAKKNYEQKCRDKDEAEQAVHRSANVANPRQQEKVFEAQECERINFFRNALWLHVNQLSQQCVTNDEMYEQVRKSLEMCSIEKDIQYFVNQRKTGQTPPGEDLSQFLNVYQMTLIIPWLRTTLCSINSTSDEKKAFLSYCFYDVKRP